MNSAKFVNINREGACKLVKTVLDSANFLNSRGGDKGSSRLLICRFIFRRRTADSREKFIALFLASKVAFNKFEWFSWDQKDILLKKGKAYLCASFINIRLAMRRNYCENVR